MPPEINKDVLPFSMAVAPVAYQCLADIESYKSGIVGAQQAVDVVDNLLMASVANIIQVPERYRFNVHLSDRGLMLRERLGIECKHPGIHVRNGFCPLNYPPR